MTRAKTKEQIAVMKAFCEGKTIEARQSGSRDWSETMFPDWNWHSYDYRIKPEPKRVYALLRNSGAVVAYLPTREAAKSKKSRYDKSCPQHAPYTIEEYVQVLPKE